MTKSTITRERIQRIIRAINSEAYDEEEIREWLSSDEIMELSRMALAAMDSEPVELPLDYLQGHKDGLEWAAQLAEANHPETGDWLYDDPIELAKAIRKGPDMPPVQPVADSEPVAYIFKHPAGRLFWSLTDESNKGHDDVMPVYDSPQSPGSEPATVPGKWIPVSERMPDCWCLTCRPVTLNDMRFVVCPDCGNKRCPRANDHRNACTRSNEPGQEGSAYPAAPQEVRGE